MDILDGLMDNQKTIAKTLDEPVFVAAGAGSGKTFTLTRRVVWALTPGSGADGGPFLDSIDQALIITFTNKAAAEIKERLRKALHEAGLHDQALRVDGAWVSTIHGMCSRILHAHALDLGINPQFSMGGDHAMDDLMAKATDAVFSAASKDPRFRPLWREYGDRAAGQTTLRPMVATILKAVGNAPRGFDSLEFPDAPVPAESVARELAATYGPLESLTKLSEKAQAHVDILLADAASLEAFLGLPPSQRTWEALAPILAGLTKVNGQFFKGAEKAPIKDAIMGEWNRARALGEFERVRPLRPLLMDLARKVKEAYDVAKAEVGVLDNDDLITLAAHALETDPAIAADYAGRFRLVMVDEFQDTNAQQVAMVRTLAGPDAPLCTVGDAQQSIYRFRGADVDVFRRQQESGAGVVTMARNFRSSDEVLRFVAKVCGEGGAVADFMDLEADPHRADGYPLPEGSPRIFLECVTTPYTNGATADGLGAQEAAQISDRLARLAAQGVAPGDMAVLLRGMRDADLYISALRERGLDCVIAGGSTFADAPEVAQVAALLKVLANPADTQGGLYPVLAGEMFRLDPNDFLALATRENEQTQEPDKRAVDRGVRAFSFYPGIEPSERLKAAQAVLEDAWRSMGHVPVADVVLTVVRRSGWLDRLADQGTAGRARAANVLKAVGHVRDLCEGAGLGPARAADEFEAWLASAKEGPATLSGGRSDAVSIMTIHASKGLEFPVVAVVGAFGEAKSISGKGVVASAYGDKVQLALRPSSRSAVDIAGPADDDLEALPDEREGCRDAYEWRYFLERDEKERDEAEVGRLLYVALTRAREALVVGVTAKIQKSKVVPLPAGALLDQLFGGVPDAGCHPFSYGGALQGVARVSHFAAGDKKRGIEPELQEGDEPAEATILGSAEGGAETAFELFDVEVPRIFPRPVGARDDVYSYSSAHEEALAKGLAYDPYAEGAVVLTMDDEMEEALEPSDADRATSFGSAFHELAQLMVETGGDPGPVRVDSVARAWGVRKRDMARLTEALGRWERSDLRREVLTWPQVGAEVPFFVERPSEYGRWVNGFIDLLATEEDGPHGRRALVVDYKTGDRDLTEEQAWKSHRMQAELYGSMLKDQGYGSVECAFVLVEKDDGHGQPVVLHYR